MQVFPPQVFSVWIAPGGRVIHCFETHSDEVISNPREFGLPAKDLSDLKPWEIYEILFEKGYIRLGKFGVATIGLPTYYVEFYSRQMDEVWEFFKDNQDSLGANRKVVVEIAKPNGSRYPSQTLTVAQIVAYQIEV